MFSNLDKFTFCQFNLCLCIYELYETLKKGLQIVLLNFDLAYDTSDSLYLDCERTKAFASLEYVSNLNNAVWLFVGL